MSFQDSNGSARYESFCPIRRLTENGALYHSSPGLWHGREQCLLYRGLVESLPPRDTTFPRLLFATGKGAGAERQRKNVGVARRRSAGKVKINDFIVSGLPGTLVRFRPPGCEFLFLRRRVSKSVVVHVGTSADEALHGQAALAMSESLQLYRNFLFCQQRGEEATTM